MQRFVKSLDLKDASEAPSGYIKAHEEIPAEIINGIKAVGITRMDLYLQGNRVIMVMECPDFIQIDKALEKLATLPGQEQWENFVSNFQKCDPLDSSAEKWKEMKKIFSLPRPKVFVSLPFKNLQFKDFLFLKEASRHGDLYVGIDSEEILINLNKRSRFLTEKEHLFMINSIRYVKYATLLDGFGKKEFIDFINKLQPDIFIDGLYGASSEEKRKFCEELGIKYIRLQVSENFLS